jgi:hypothetical protein
VQDKARSGAASGTVSTLENLSVYLTLEKASTTCGFRRDACGLDDAQAFDIAKMFSKCAAPPARAPVVLTSSSVP